MEQLMKSLHIFFTYLNELNLKWHNNIEKAAKPLNAFRNQAEQLRLVKKFEDNDDNAELPNLKSRLISKIKLGVEEELSLLKEILKEFEISNKDLKKKLVFVEQRCEAVETEAMLRGTATQPAPYLMVEWAEDAWRLYHAFYIQIYGALRCLNCEDEDSVVRFQTAFQEDAKMKCHIERMLAYTKFFVEGF
ncbi:uncharacterized protein LOC110838405 [Zootermopsis nevadensis]|uniref:Uncharacterized protein n=1 Tax=Zootermopsis nevadensis TaxID=136037 RepID=A0A067QNH5_ZOONE|nr:uncharacterized protein LOC110838405 [Zootermopsis nevadensis]XP_021937257.1 uncharacterized protein LOC110838405 [Zootermopsis nevadensis]KDR09922.1 hypothetical protein L798_00359 [Zootermopsis nevadensis]